MNAARRLTLSGFATWAIFFATGAKGQDTVVRLSLFGEPGCRACLAISNEVLPVIQERYDGFYRVTFRDIGVKSNYLQLVAYQRQFDILKNEPVMFIVDESRGLNGLESIRTGLCAAVEEALERRLAGFTPPPPPPPEPESRVASRLEEFTPGMVVVAGLLDGLNPCAISALVFFVSVLAVARVHRSRILAVGLAFCAAAFLTYTLLGLGLLSGLRALTGFTLVRGLFEAVLAALLGVLAILSFRDAYLFKKSGRASDVTLQVPDRVKRLVHERMRDTARSGRIVAAGFVTGMLTTILESVCTGQVYLPTLALLIRNGQGGTRVWGYLLLYNALFTLPLLVVFFAVYRGVRTPQLLEWSRRHVVAAKVGLGLLFLILASILILA